jgi:hypothetical protein
VWPTIEVTAVESFLPTGERLVAVFIAKDSDVPLNRLEHFENVALGVVNDDFIDILTGGHLDLPFNNALNRLVLLGPASGRVGLNANNQIVTDCSSFLKHQHMTRMEEVKSSECDSLPHARSSLL